MLRPRIVVYALLLIAITAATFYGIATRVPLELNIIRDRNTLYRETTTGLVENIYTLKILNMDERDHRYRLSISGPEGMSLHMREPMIFVASGSVVEIPVQLRIDPVELKRTGYDVQFHLQAADEPELEITQTGRFIGPVMR